LLDYQAEPATSDPLAGGVTPPTDAPVGTIAVSPVIVALPPLSLPRTIEGTRWILSSEFALRFANRAAANAAEDSAAVIRDAIRGYLQSLPPAAFTTPDQAAMKRELGALLATVLPGFAAHDLLIPALDANKG
jgi:flagellar basal body-associated protein FliL